MLCDNTQKHSILDVAVALDPPLYIIYMYIYVHTYTQLSDSVEDFIPNVPNVLEIFDFWNGLPEGYLRNCYKSQSSRKLLKLEAVLMSCFY